jgi:hypothetical protein
MFKIEDLTELESQMDALCSKTGTRLPLRGKVLLPNLVLTVPTDQ